MSFLDIKDVRIAGIATALPKTVARNADLLAAEGKKKEEIDGFIDQVGIIERRESQRLTATDLGCEAGEKLIADLGWEKSSIDAIIMVTISPDYTLPVNACILQDRLGLSRECYAQDLCMACSGWVYGLSVIASLVSSGNAHRALLFTGDARIHWGTGNDDLLFGHAISVTAVEFAEGADGFKFHFGTDGSGYDAVIMPKSGMRNISYEEDYERKFSDLRNQCSKEGVMKGMDVFAFSITQVPKSFKALENKFGLKREDFDYVVLHQANMAINQRVVRKLGIDPAKAPTSLAYYGNTEASSIPATITSQLKGKIEQGKKKLLCCGFGTGLSWGTVALTTDNIVISETIEVEENRFDDIKWV